MLTLGSAITDINTERRKVYGVCGLARALLRGRQWFPKSHHYGRWDMGASFHTWNKESIYEMETHLHACAEEIQSCAISMEGHGHRFLRLWRSCEYTVYENDTPINADAYCATLTSLRNAIKNNRRGKIIKCIGLLHENATPHTAHTTKDLQRFRGRFGSIHHTFQTLRHAITIFSASWKIIMGKEIFQQWGNSNSGFYYQGIERLVKRSDRCLQRHGEYVEK